MLSSLLETVFRREQARLMAGLARFTRDLDLAEEALQEAFLRASTRWPTEGLPENPGAWLTTVSRNVAVDLARARQRRARVQPDDPSDAEAAAAEETGAPQASGASEGDDSLLLLLACCRPELPERTQTSLALKVVLGLSTREIARAFLEDERSTAQRVVRAKRQLKALGERFELPSVESLPGAIAATCRMVYLLFNEGHAATSGPSQLRVDLCAEALRLARLLHSAAPSPRTKGLLALLLLTAARLPARVDAQGALVPLDRQDRSTWNKDQIVEGLALLDDAFATTPHIQGPAVLPDSYVVQAAIAALHCRAQAAQDTDWPQIAALYGVLLRVEPTPVVQLNAAVALALAGKLSDGLEWLNRLERDEPSLEKSHVLPLARAELLWRKGSLKPAERALRRARRLAENDAERAFLDARLSTLSAAMAAEEVVGQPEEPKDPDVDP